MKGTKYQFVIFLLLFFSLLVLTSEIQAQNIRIRIIKQDAKVRLMPSSESPFISSVSIGTIIVI